MKILTDFHHGGLHRSLQLLFEDRLGHQLYRPIGLEWYDEGFWSVYDHPSTVLQYLSIGGLAADGTPPLNDLPTQHITEPGVVLCYAAGKDSVHRACSLDYVRSTYFDLFIASMPQHVPLFQRLIQESNPQAKLIYQVGNDWNLAQFPGVPVLASVLPRRGRRQDNILYYRQEFDLKLFNYVPPYGDAVISLVNNLADSPKAWRTFLDFERQFGTPWRSYGGQCRDGSLPGETAVADALRSSAIVYHVKPGGDGYGHVLHNAYAQGRPVITRAKDYKNTLGSLLLQPGTFLDLDKVTFDDACVQIAHLLTNPDVLASVSHQVHLAFESVVDFEHDAHEVRSWLERVVL